MAVTAPGVPHCRAADGAGEPLKGERQGHQPVNDGVYAAVAGGRTAGESVARGAVIPAALEVEGNRQPLLLGRFHPDRPVALNSGGKP